jgi:pimeloyl-ACP methyl ester carboxylesterase
MNFFIFSIITTCLAVISPYNTINILGESKFLSKRFHSYPKNTENLYVYLPQNPSRTESYPVVLFFSGFGSNLPPKLYGRVLEEISSKANGAVVVAWDGLGVSNPLDMPGIVKRVDRLVDYVTSWDLQATISQKFKNSVKSDPSRLFFMGHSSGSQIAYVMADRYPSAAGLILLDPVDSDPVQWTSPVIPLNSKVKYSKPVLVLASGRGGERGIKIGSIGFPPCCPADYSATHFYDAFVNAPKYFVEAFAYGVKTLLTKHADLLSPDGVALGGHYSHFCATVINPRLNPFQAYRDLVSGSVASFLAMYGSSLPSLACEYSKFLTDNSTLQVEGS